MTFARRFGLFLLVTVVFAAGCSRCGKGPSVAGGAGELTERLPRSAELVFAVPDLAVLGDRLAILENLKVASFAAQLQGLPSAQAFVNAALGQLGVDLRSPEAIKKAGISPAKGLAFIVARDAQGKELAYSVVGVEDPKDLEALATRMAKARLGASEIDAQDGPNGQRRITYSRTKGGPPELALVIDRGYGFLSTQATVEALATSAALPPDQGLSSDEGFKKGMARLEGPKDAWAFAPGQSAAARRFYASGTLLAFHLSKDAFTVRADLPWPNTRESLKVLEDAGGAAAAALVKRLSPSTFAAVRYGGDPALLAPYWQSLVGPAVAKAVSEAGFDISGEVLSNVQPGWVAGLELAPTPPLGSGVPTLDVRRTNPFRYVHFTAYAQVKDAAKAQATLSKLPPIGQRFGATMREEERPGAQKVILTTYARGDGVHVALKGNMLLLASPTERLDAALKADDPAAAKDAAGPSAELAKGLTGHPVSAVVDVKRLADSVRELPANAWGVGGFAIKATTVRWLAAVDDLTAITAGLWAKDGAIQGEVALRLGAK